MYAPTERSAAHLKTSCGYRDTASGKTGQYCERLPGQLCRARSCACANSRSNPASSSTVTHLVLPRRRSPPQASSCERRCPLFCRSPSLCLSVPAWSPPRRKTMHPSALFAHSSVLTQAPGQTEPRSYDSLPPRPLPPDLIQFPPSERVVISVRGPQVHRDRADPTNPCSRRESTGRGYLPTGECRAATRSRSSRSLVHQDRGERGRGARHIKTHREAFWRE